MQCKTEESLFDVKASADLALSYLDIETAGHSITTLKPLFSLFDFGEIYRYTKDKLEKKDYFSLNFKDYFSLQGQTGAESSSGSQKQNYLAHTSAGFKTSHSSHKITFKYTADQNEDSRESGNTFLTPKSNYFISWYDITLLQFTDGFKDADRKTALFAQYKSSYDFLKLSPDISLELTGRQAEKNLFLAGDTLKFTLPFTTDSNAFSFVMTHKGSIEKNQRGSNYSDDIENIFSNQNSLLFFYKSIPFYSLFDKGYKTNILSQDFSSSGNLEYNVTWRRKLFNNIKDLYLPVSASAGFSRDVIHTVEKDTDTYQLKGRLSSNFINLFGSNSSLNYFDWYRQEEYTGFVSALVKFSPESRSSPYFQISSGELLMFYI